MIKIHNFYTDLLLSLRYLFDNIVFGPGMIKTYEFNIGNRTLQLDYKSQYGMPNCIISYLDSNPNQYHPWLILRDSMGNHSKFPILYNKTKNLSLELQEELYDINIGVVLNFESQLSAIDAEHRLKANIPLNKPLQIYHFYTFFEIPDRFLEPDIFDVNNDQIINLYMKHDSLTDKIVHCASVRYEPLIVLESCQATLSNSEQRSFSVDCNFRFMQSVPMYMQIPEHEQPRNREIVDIIESNVAVPINDNIPILKLIIKLKNDDNIKQYIPIYPQEGKFSQDFLFTYDNIDYVSNISGLLSGINQSIGTFKVTLGKSNEDVECTFKLIDQVEPFVHSITISGPVSGYISNFKMDNGKLTGMLHGSFNNTNYDNESIVNYQISGDYITTSQLVGINPIVDINIPEFPIEYDYTCNSIIFGPIHSNMPHLNTDRIKFVPDKTRIIGAIIVEKDTKLAFTTSMSGSLDKYGNFNISIDHTHSVNKNIIYATVKGKVHPKTLYLRYDFIDEQSDCNIDVVCLLFDFNFKSVPKYGGQLIERIDLSITTDTFEPIAVGISSRFFEDEFNRIQKEHDKTLVKSFVLTPSLNNDIFDSSDGVKLFVRFDYNIAECISINPNKYQWQFMFDNAIYEYTGNLIKLEPYNISSPYNTLVFKIDDDLYDNELKNYSVSNPIFFQLYEKF